MQRKGLGFGDSGWGPRAFSGVLGFRVWVQELGLWVEAEGGATCHVSFPGLLNSGSLLDTVFAFLF